MAALAIARLESISTTITHGVLPPSTKAHDGTPPAGSLTTIWAAPPDCISHGFDDSTTVISTWTSNPLCDPPGWSSYWNDAAGYYSPAICPGLYTLGCTRYTDIQGPPLEPSETASNCVMK